MNRKIAYGTPITGNGGITSLGSSSTFVAGYEWFIIDNTSNLMLDYLIQGQIMVGTNPTINTEIRIYLVASYDGISWADVFDGTPSAETITSAGVRDGFAKLAASLNIDANTTDRIYPFSFTIAQFFGGVMPKKVGVFVTHNTGVNLNSTPENHIYAAQPIYETVA